MREIIINSDLRREFEIVFTHTVFYIGQVIIEISVALCKQRR